MDENESFGLIVIMITSQVFIFNKKTKQYYHSKTKKWLEYPPQYCVNDYSHNCYVDIIQFCSNYNKILKQHQSTDFEPIDLKDLEVIKKTSQIANTNKKTLFQNIDIDEKRIGFDEIYESQMIFAQYQKSMGYLLSNFIKEVYDLDQIKKYQYIVKFKDSDTINNHRINISTNTVNNILRKLNIQKINETDVLFKNPFMLIQNEEHLLSVKLVASEHICQIEKLDPIVDAWTKINILN